MPDDSVPVPAPGWYPHPADIGSELYWDGASWTDRSRPAAPPAPAAPVYGTPTSTPYGSPAQNATPAQNAEPELYAYPSAPSSAARRNPLAIASLVLGIVSILINPLLVPSILAIVFGIRGRAAAPVLGGGGGFATAGLITGIVGIVTGAISFLVNLSGLSG